VHPTGKWLIAYSVLCWICENVQPQSGALEGLSALVSNDGFQYDESITQNV
jgi:hypothetical protein